MPGELGLFRTLVEQSRDVLFRYRLTPSPGCEFVSPSVEALTGYTAKEWCARPELVRSLVHEEDRPLVEEILAGRRPPPDRLRLRFHHRDGGTRWVELRAAPFALRDGSTGFDGTAREVSREVELETRTRADETRLRTLIDASPAAIVLVDAAGQIVLANARTPELFGYEPAELEGHDIAVLVPDAARGLHAAQVREYLDRPVARDLGHGRHLQARRRDGTVFPAEIALTPVDGASGEHHVLATIFDITEREVLEAQLRQSQRFESIGQLAGGIAHDFNNLLTAIHGYAELLQQNLPADDPNRADAEQIALAADRAAELTRQLLAFSRRQVLQPRILDPGEVVSSVAPMLRRLLGEHIELATYRQPGTGHVRVDPSQLEQVIVNLAVNARDAMPAGGTLTVEVTGADLDDAFAAGHAGVRQGRYVSLAVSDTGAGMDAATRARAFEPFFTTKAPGTGNGMGLATVYGIVKQSGGAVYIYSEPGVGTSVRIYLPRVEAPGEPEPVVAAPLPLPSGSETILLVEDERAVRTYAARVLERQGYTVLQAENGNDALLLAGRGRPIDLLVTDIVMPGLQGHELAARLRTVRPDLRVLYVSGFTAESVIRGNGSGARVAFLPKPYSGAALARAVHTALVGAP